MKNKKQIKQELEDELKEWEEHQPINNMSSWARQVRIDSIKNKLKKIENAEIKSKGRGKGSQS